MLETFHDDFAICFETVEKPASERLMENGQMQGFRNPEE